MPALSVVCLVQSTPTAAQIEECRCYEDHYRSTDGDTRDSSSAEWRAGMSMTAGPGR